MKTVYLHTELHLTLEGVDYKITRITVDDICYLERISDSAITTYSKTELTEYLTQGKIVFQGKKQKKHQESFSLEASLKLIPEDKRELVLKRYAYVKNASAAQLIPTRKNLDGIIQNTTDVIGDVNPPSSITLYRWWRRWYEADYDLYALVSRPSGKVGSHKFKGKFKTIFYKTVEEVYLTRERCSKQTVFDVLSYRIVEHNSKSLNQILMPSRATIYRMIDGLNDYMVMSARHGQRETDTYYRISGKGVFAQHILSRVEVDHTPLDVIVVDEEGKAIGRPNCTCLFDVHPQMPLGLYIGFESPSELSVIHAFRQAIFPKTELIKGYSDIENEWAAYGIPSLLVCDNGMEFHSRNLRRICAELNVELQFCPKQEPNYKGHVERFLGTLNKQVCHKLRGTTFSNINERGSYDPVGLACITLRELKELVYQWLVDIYCQSSHGDFEETPVMKWFKSRKFIEPRLPESKASLDLILTREYRRKISHEGIQFARLFYNSEVLRQMRIMHGHQSKVVIRVDLEDLCHIWVYDAHTETFIPVPCTDQEYAKGVTLIEHKAYCDFRRQQAQESVDSVSLLASKGKYWEKQKAMNHKKVKIRDRKKVARIQSNEGAPPFSSNALKSLSKKPNIHLVNINEIPNFDVIQKGGRS